MSIVQSCILSFTFQTWYPTPLSLLFSRRSLKKSSPSNRYSVHRATTALTFSEQPQYNFSEQPRHLYLFLRATATVSTEQPQHSHSPNNRNTISPSNHDIYICFSEQPLQCPPSNHSTHILRTTAIQFLRATTTSISVSPSNRYSVHRATTALTFSEQPQYNF